MVELPYSRYGRVKLQGTEDMPDLGKPYPAPLLSKHIFTLVPGSLTVHSMLRHSAQGRKTPVSVRMCMRAATV